jgi:VIT1/CCC1 family predicted Fe2+/Mn2+ transporter
MQGTGIHPPWTRWLSRIFLGSESHEVTEQGIALKVIQPALSGLMDGSVSTLAPIFAAAVYTQQSHTAFIIGLAAATGAGISMGFAEALSDDGELTGRGKPLPRGIITGAATFVGGILHSLPFLIPDFRVALILAMAVVCVELVVIALIRHRFFQIPRSRSALQVMLGGGLVFAAGIILGKT